VTFADPMRLGALVKFTTLRTSGITTPAAVAIYEPAGTGAVSTTVQAKLREIVSVMDFGAVGDGVTDDTAAIQAAIDSGNSVIVPNGVYLCANLQMRTGLRLTGESLLAVLKLMPNATAASFNGGVADSNGFYPANIIGSTLTHNGGTWDDGGVRATDENNNTYIYENIIIENLTLDGNKSNNQIGDLGLNRSAMGAGVAIHQCKNVTIRGCRIINQRLDGIHVGYSLHGGSDYCKITGNHFEGNQRTNIALITGKYNTVSGNTGLATTGGTGVSTGAALDIEANLVGEVNWRHTVSENNLGGVLAINGAQVAKMQNTVCTGNVWVGGLTLSGSDMTSGCVIDGDTFIATSASQDWLTRYGPNVAPTTVNPTVIRNCSASGFGRVLVVLAQGAMENLSVSECVFNTQSFGTLVRGYKVEFSNNVFNFSGNADAATIALSNTLGGTVPNQGKIGFYGNTFYGVSQATFISITRDSTWPFAANDYTFGSRNEFKCTGHTAFMTTSGSVTVDDNLIENFTPIGITTLNQFRFISNDVRAAVAQNLFSGQTTFFNDNEISDNDLVNVSVNAGRPKDCTIVSNRIVDGAISLTYSFTSTGIGRNHVAFNYMTSKSVIASPFTVSIGGGYAGTDFVGNDQYKYNTYVGYTGAASITASIAGKYDGTFG